MRKILHLSILFVMMLAACQDPPVPKPRGFFRIDFPEKNYQPVQMACPYTFEIPGYAQLEMVTPSQQNCWMNVVFPQFNATIHISYMPVHNNLGVLLEDTYNFAYKHVQKADAIDNFPLVNREKDVYGLLYQIKGDVASSRQFYLTDSTKHYLRGALYFNEVPNKDSLAPVLDFLSEDIEKMITTFEWVDQ